jgi:imidazolonepropionase-like amidohydrolase
MRLPLPALLLLLFPLCLGHAQDLLLRNATIVDPATRSVHKGSIVIRDGKIADVLVDPPAAFSGRIVDLDGKWVMPGLNDMHVHSFGNLAPGGKIDMLGTEGSARAMLYAGVTGFLDLFSPEDAIFAARDWQRSQGMLGADIYCAGPILTCTGGHGTEYGLPTRIINTPADARREVTSLAAKHPDVVKIVYDHAASWMPTIDHATMTAAVETASKLGLKTVIHIGTWNDAREAIEAGATCITHVYLNDPIPDSLVALMRQRKIYETPTMTVENDLLAIMRNPALRRRPLLEAVASADVLAAYADSTALDPRFKGFMQWQAGGEGNLMTSVKRMSDGGVRLLAGTDAGNPGTFQGYSLHRELELMVKAGMTPWEVLAAATTGAGEFLGRDFGIRPGAVANLLVLDASPIDDIANTQRIAAVIYHGVPVDRAELLHPTARPWSASLIDDFSSADLRSSSGPTWSRDIDTAWGGSSTMTAESRGGTLHLRGKLVPKPGVPGLAGISLQFDSSSAPVDLSEYDGVKLRIKSSGPVALKMLTSGVKNYDYHAAAIPASSTVRELTLPFSDFRQLWSAPIPWTGHDVTGIALWVSGMSPTDYDLTIDSIELYKAKH